MNPLGENEAQKMAAAHAANREASGWMKRGLALLDEKSPASLAEALTHFERAIELRRTLPLAADPLFRYGLAACWMNRGDALTRLGSAANLAAALQSYDTALEVLRDLPLDENPLFRRRVAIAWQNRGITLQTQGDGNLAEAAKSFGETIAVLQNEKAAAIADRDYLLATAWMNQANALVRDHHPTPAKGRRPTSAHSGGYHRSQDAPWPLSASSPGIFCVKPGRIARRRKPARPSKKRLDHRSNRRRGRRHGPGAELGAAGGGKLPPAGLAALSFWRARVPILSAGLPRRISAGKSRPGAFAGRAGHGRRPARHRAGSARPGVPGNTAPRPRTLAAPQLDALEAQLHDLRALEQRLDDLRNSHLPAG